MSVKSRRILIIGTPTNFGYSAMGLDSILNGGFWVENYLKAFEFNDNYKIGYVFFGNVKKYLNNKSNNIDVYCIQDFKYSKSNFPQKTKKYLMNVIDDFAPDIIHIFGTERPYTEFIVNKYNINKVIVSITGLIGPISKNYLACISKSTIRSNITFGDFVRMKGILMQKKSFEKKALHEIKSINKCANISGRTEWDKKYFHENNKNGKYYFCNESLNDVFYEKAGTWSYEMCEKHSIFMGSGSYPLKGLHIVLDALPTVLKKYPDTVLKIAGIDICDHKSFGKWLRFTNYGKIIWNKILKLGLRDNVEFLGLLDSKSMCEMYTKANCFVMSSIIENSSNTLGEAMIVGTPCISTCGGGLSSMVFNEKNALTYDFPDVQKLSNNIIELFDRENHVKILSEGGVNFAKSFFSKENMKLNAIKMYEELFNNGKE